MSAALTLITSTLDILLGSNANGDLRISVRDKDLAEHDYTVVIETYSRHQRINLLWGPQMPEVRVIGPSDWSVTTGGMCLYVNCPRGLPLRLQDVSSGKFYAITIFTRRLTWIFGPPPRSNHFLRKEYTVGIMSDGALVLPVRLYVRDKSEQHMAAGVEAILSGVLRDDLGLTPIHGTDSERHMSFWKEWWGRVRALVVSRDFEMFMDEIEGAIRAKVKAPVTAEALGKSEIALNSADVERRGAEIDMMRAEAQKVRAETRRIEIENIETILSIAQKVGMSSELRIMVGPILISQISGLASVAMVDDVEAFEREPARMMAELDMGSVDVVGSQ